MSEKEYRPDPTTADFYRALPFKPAIGIALSTFSQSIGEATLHACLETLHSFGLDKPDLYVATAPGALELPLTLSWLAQRREPDPEAEAEAEAGGKERGRAKQDASDERLALFGFASHARSSEPGRSKKSGKKGPKGKKVEKGRKSKIKDEARGASDGAFDPCHGRRALAFAEAKSLAHPDLRCLAGLGRQTQWSRMTAPWARLAADERPLDAQMLHELRPGPRCGSPLSFDALIAIGVVVRGETYHFELVSDNSAQGVMRVSLDCGIPIANAILTTENAEQARARMIDKGHQAAQVVLRALQTKTLIDAGVSHEDAGAFNSRLAQLRDLAAAAEGVRL